MIVLDEQLIGYDLQPAIAKWYRGSVVDITQLRPGTVIKDEAIPVLLREQHGPVFVTINVRDFWRRLDADAHFMIACFAVSDDRAERVSLFLRRASLLADAFALASNGWESLHGSASGRFATTRTVPGKSRGSR